MLRVLIQGLAILHLGPGIAFALLAFGCDDVTPLLGAICGTGVLSSFVRITAVAWVILLVGLVAVHFVRHARTAMPPTIGSRVKALLALVATGALMGGAWVWLTGSTHGFAAIPVALAAGWLLLADPQTCSPRH
jgi:hypothetical protein